MYLVTVGNAFSAHKHVYIGGIYSQMTNGVFSARVVFSFFFFFFFVGSGTQSVLRGRGHPSQTYLAKWYRVLALQATAAMLGASRTTLSDAWEPSRPVPCGVWEAECCLGTNLVQAHSSRAPQLFYYLHSPSGSSVKLLLCLRVDPPFEIFFILALDNTQLK